MRALRKAWLYRGVYPEIAKNGWQIGVRFPKRISAKRKHRILQELGMTTDLFGLDTYNHVRTD